MAEPFYRVGELRGPFPVVFDSFEYLANGRTLEIVRDSMGNGSMTYGYDDDREYHTVRLRGLDMPILVPYTKRHPFTEQGLEGQNATWVDVSGSAYDYWWLLCDWWKNQDLTIVEHDVRASPEIFTEFAECPEPWSQFTHRK